jgi:hypothetical protein
MASQRSHGLWRPLGLVGVALMLAIGTTDSGSGRQPVRNDPGTPPGFGETLPPDLDRVPRDAATVAAVRVADLWKSPVAVELRKQLGKEAAKLPEQFTHFIGLAPDKVERTTFVVLEPKPGGAPLILVRARETYDRDKVCAATGTDASVKEEDNVKLYLNRSKKWALHVVDDRDYLLGEPAAVKAFLARPRKKDGPLAAALALAAQKHAAVVGFNGIALEGIAAVEPELKPQLEALSTLANLRYGTLVCDLTDDLRVQLTLNFSRLLGKAPRKKPAAVVRLTLEVETDLPALVAPLLRGIAAGRQAGARNQAATNYKQIGIAFSSYFDQHKHFPPAAIYDKSGKPLLSWRVLLLPYLDDGNFFGQFHLDEPWDSAHNKKLLTKMPKVFAPVGSKKTRPGETYIQGLVGKDAFLDPAKKKGVTLTDVPDGVSNTIVLVESPTAVPWTKPEDLPFDATKPLPKMGGHFPGGFLALFADGHVSFLPQKIDPVILKRLITRNERVAPNQGIPREKAIDY